MPKQTKGLKGKRILAQFKTDSATRKAREEVTTLLQAVHKMGDANIKKLIENSEVVIGDSGENKKNGPKPKQHNQPRAASTPPEKTVSTGSNKVLPSNGVTTVQRGRTKVSPVVDAPPVLGTLGLTPEQVAEWKVMHSKSPAKTQKEKEEQAINQAKQASTIAGARALQVAAAGYTTSLVNEGWGFMHNGDAVTVPVVTTMTLGVSCVMWAANDQVEQIYKDSIHIRFPAAVVHTRLCDALGAGEGGEQEWSTRKWIQIRSKGRLTGR